MSSPQLETVVVQLVYPTGSGFTAQAGVDDKMKGTTSGSSYDVETDTAGEATFKVPVGVYDVSATDTRSQGGTSFSYNGLQSSVAITNSWSPGGVISLPLQVSHSGQVVIKEVFVGGTPKDDGSGAFAFDKYIVLYNNSSTVANLDSICVAMISPYNAQASNGYYDASGNLTYASQGWIPAVQGYWYFQQAVSLDPGKQVVIALNNAVNNTVTYNKSINFDNPAYYCTYDITKFANTSYYVTPAASIPTSHYLKAQAYGLGNAWSISVTSPGVFLFTPGDGYTPQTFAADASRTNTLSAYTSKEVPVTWVIDGVETFLLNNTANVKRFPATVDAGYVYHTNNLGYSIYRNVDKTATEAISDNTGKLVHGYSLGTTDVGGTTDPSGIDAEASIKNGARIVYMDTNNSTNDFHLRKQATLRTN